MKIRDLDRHLRESSSDPLHHSIRYTMPHSVVIPEMDEYYEYYRFATALAGYPNTENSHANVMDLRNNPVAVAYTPQEMEMIKDTARRLGFATKDVAGSTVQEAPGGNTVSPVMRFNAFDSLGESMRDIIMDHYQSLAEARTTSLLHPDVKNTMNSTTIIPELVSSDAYKQYRYTLALAAAKAVAAGEIDFNALSAWNESMTAVAYTPAEDEIIELANQLMDVKGVKLSDHPSREPDDTNTVSPVMRFNAFDSLSLSESMRSAIDRLNADDTEVPPA
jgi:hypothetical protein